MSLGRYLSALGATVLALILVGALGCTNRAPSPTPTPVAAVEQSQPPPSPTPVPPTEPPATEAPTATAKPVAATEPVRLRVFCAGSLMIPFAEIEAAFEAAHPEIDVEVEAHGSIQVIRHVTDIHEKIDVVAPADYALLSMLMYNTADPDTGQPYANWAIRYATNHMAVAYAPESKGADEINVSNWWEVIAQPRTRVGLSDPRFDACGYRQLMVLQLAEAVYDDDRLFESVLMGRFRQPILPEDEGDVTMIHVPELLDPLPNGTIIMRGSSIQLIPLLQSGDADYIFEYESVARQHDLDYIALPDALNLGDPAHADAYAQVAVQLDFRRFAAVEPVFYGEPIAYGLTIPSNAPHPDEAALFIAFLLGPEGRRIMEANHHPLLERATVDHPERLPEMLAPLCVPES